MRKSTDDDHSSDSTKRFFENSKKVFFLILKFSSRSTEHSRLNNVENIYDTIKNESSS